jgi:hypothetical protein
MDCVEKSATKKKGNNWPTNLFIIKVSILYISGRNKEIKMDLK